MTITHGTTTRARGNDMVTMGTSHGHDADSYVATEAPGISLGRAASQCPAVSLSLRQHASSLTGVFQSLFAGVNLIGQEPTSLSMTADDGSTLTLTHSCLSRASARHTGLCVDAQYTFVGQSL